MFNIKLNRLRVWIDSLFPVRKRCHKGWYWYPLNITSIEDNGFKHRHFLFFKYNESGRFVVHKYYCRDTEIEKYTDREMAEQVINAAVFCGYWEDAKI